MSRTIIFICGNCGNRWSETVQVSVRDMLIGFQLVRKCPQCSSENRFSSGVVETIVDVASTVVGQVIKKSKVD